MLIIQENRIKKIKNKKYLLERLRFEKNNQINGGIYHKLMIDLTYNSNHIEGNELTHDETRYIFETRTIGSREWQIGHRLGKLKN